MNAPDRPSLNTMVQVSRTLTQIGALYELAVAGNDIGPALGALRDQIAAEQSAPFSAAWAWCGSAIESELARHVSEFAEAQREDDAALMALAAAKLSAAGDLGALVLAGLSND